jgi:hypothetical protein
VLDSGALQVSAGPSSQSADSDILNIELLQRALADNRLRVFPIEFDGQRYWIKRLTKNVENPISALAYRFRSWISGKGEEALGTHEVESLAALRRHGFLTPDVVFRNAHYIVLTDLGPSLESVLTQTPPEQRAPIVSKAGEALRTLHNAGRWHGAARTHNMTLSGDRIGFIDLENTVDSWLPFYMRKVWDLWQLGHSAAFFAPHVPLAETALRAYGPGTVRKFLYSVAVLFFGTYASLYPFRNTGKREIRQIHALMRAIYRAPRKAPADI